MGPGAGRREHMVIHEEDLFPNSSVEDLTSPSSLVKVDPGDRKSVAFYVVGTGKGVFLVHCEGMRDTNRLVWTVTG